MLNYLGLKPLKADDSETPAERKLLEARQDQIDFSSLVNKTQVVQATQDVTTQPGFSCKICGIVVKDSVNYLDHINGWKRMWFFQNYHSCLSTNLLMHYICQIRPEKPGNVHESRTKYCRSSEG